MALNICHDVIVDSERGRELAQHGSALFPIACYAEDLSSYSVAWHWHEEFEYVLCMKGPLHVDVNKTRLTLQTGQGVFINSGGPPRGGTGIGGHGSAPLGSVPPAAHGGHGYHLLAKAHPPHDPARRPGLLSAG